MCSACQVNVIRMGAWALLLRWGVWYCLGSKVTASAKRVDGGQASVWFFVPPPEADPAYNLYLARVDTCFGLGVGGTGLARQGGQRHICRCVVPELFEREPKRKCCLRSSARVQAF
jgi:hypothetical protein